MIDPAQAQKDAEQLRLLSIFHYVVGALIGLMACFPLIHFAVGLAMVSGKFPPPRPGEPSPEVIGWFFVGIAAAGILAGWTLAILVITAGRCIARRRWYIFCNVVAGLMAVTCMPLGTALGGFTIFVLQRPSVKEAFGTTITFVGD